MSADARYFERLRPVILADLRLAAPADTEDYLELKYGPNGERVIQTIRRVSKPGRRLYTRGKELKPVLGGLGISIISSSKGVISDREARRDNVGGEVVCEVA